MTRNREIERVLEEWFSDGPTHMPDHLFTAVVDRIDRVPQRRLARLKTRFFAMNSTFRLAAAAAVIVMVAGAGAFILTRSPDVASQPSPTPVASPTGKVTDSWLPPELRYKWVGTTRVVPQVDPPVARSVMELTAIQMNFGAGLPNDPILFSTVRLAGPDTIAMELVVGQYGCTAGVIGTYTYALSGTTGAGGGLSLRAVDDPCAARVSAVSGDWIRTDCPDNGGACLGNLEAGDYQSLWLNPWVVPSAWTSKIGALTFTVPAGWTNPEDCDGCFTLAQQGGPANSGIFIWDDVVAHSQAEQCSQKSEPGVGRSAAELGAWLKGLPGLVATTPAPVTIGGLSGVMLDLSVAPTWTATCPYAYSTNFPLVSTWVDANPNGGLDWNIQAEGRTRVVLLDIGDGRALVINIEAQTKADYDALLPEAMQIVNSFQFHH